MSQAGAQGGKKRGCPGRKTESVDATAGVEGIIHFGSSWAGKGEPVGCERDPCCGTNRLGIENAVVAEGKETGLGKNIQSVCGTFWGGKREEGQEG